MEDNTAKREVCKAFAIKMYPEEIERFKRIASEMDGVSTDRNALLSLMDYFENPKTVVKDNPEHVKKIEELESLINKLIEENEELKNKVEELTNSGNDNAVAAQRHQLELDKANETIAALQQEAENKNAKLANRPENIFEVEVHPVPFYFLKKMAAYLSNQKKTEITPGYILTDLFLKDLQNPLANNLPYIVTTAEISKVLEEYRKAHPEEK